MATVFPKEWLKTKTQKEVHMMSLKELQKMFNVEISKGLCSKRANELLINKEKGKRACHKRRIIIKRIFLGLADFFSIILWISIVLYGVLYGPLKNVTPDIDNLINILIISLIMLAKITVIAFQEFKSFQMTKCLQSNNYTPVLVLRDSRWFKIPVCELVVGDIIEISSNERVPADLRLISVMNLFLDKSIITGNNKQK